MADAAHLAMRVRSSAVHATDDWGHHRRSAAEKPLLEAGHERDLLERARQGDRAAVNELVESHMRLVVQIASRYGRGDLSAHDLIAEGVLGLLEAIVRFDMSRDTRFAGYAAWWVRAFVHRHAAQNRRIVGMPGSRAARVVESKLRSTERRLTQSLGRVPQRAEVAEALHVTERDLELVTEAWHARDVAITRDERGVWMEPRDQSEGPEEAFGAAESRAVWAASLRDAIEALNERERALVREHLYAEEKRSLADVGRRLGISRQRAAQILEDARQKLRARLSGVVEAMTPLTFESAGLHGQLGSHS
jgi:RNA polymerase sigma-32 factor